MRGTDRLFPLSLRMLQICNTHCRNLVHGTDLFKTHVPARRVSIDLSADVGTDVAPMWAPMRVPMPARCEQL